MNITQVDLPRVFMAAEQVKGMRNQNNLFQQQAERQTSLNSLVPKAIGGDQGAINEMYGLDPNMASKMDERQRAVAAANLEEIGKAAVWADTPEKWDQAIEFLNKGSNGAFEQYRGQFGNRPMIINRIREAKDMIGGGKPQSPLGKLKADLDAGLMTKAQYDAAVAKATTMSAGTSLNVSPEGGIEFRQGGPQIKQGAPLAKPTLGKVEGTALSSSEGLARLHAIEQSFRPEFMELDTRFNAALTAGKEKLGMDVPEADQQKLTAFTTFKRNALSNLNQYIKDITGAALSEAEARRIRAAAPDPGEGIFDGDSPSEFSAKLKATVNELELANARSVYAARIGLNALDVSLTNMRAIVNQRYTALVSEYEFAGMDKAAAKAKAQETVSQEFGL